MKFKKGDKVILVKYESAPLNFPLGIIGMVMSVDKDSIGFPINVRFENQDVHNFRESELILLTETTRILYGKKTK